MLIHDFLSGVCVGIAVVNLIWFIAIQIFVDRVILKGGQDENN